MRPTHVASYILRDLQGMGLRLPLAVSAGVVALAVATAIDTLNLAFARQAEVLMERAMKQVRTVASTLYMRPTGAGHFSSSQFERLMARVCNLERRGDLLDVSTIVESVEEDVFRLLNWDDESKEMHGILDLERAFRRGLPSVGAAHRRWSRLSRGRSVLGG